MNRKIALTALMLAAAPMALAAQAPGNGTAQTFNNTVPAAGIDKVKLEVKVGRITIKTSAADTVAIKSVATTSGSMHFIFDWTTGGNEAGKLPAGLHLVTHREGDTLVVGLASEDEKLDVDAPSAGTSGDDSVNIHVNGHNTPGWKSDWTVVLPPRLALDLVVGVGKARITGIAGGMHAKVGVGKLYASLPNGPIDANVGVGQLAASVLSDDYGSVSLSAGVGHVEFDVHGQQVDTGYNKEFTSAKQSLTGSGRTDYKLTTGVGHVELKIGVKSLKPTGSGDTDSGDDNQ